jgi:hypothetical protein
MDRYVGVWIDHRKAVIISILGAHEALSTITSDMEKHVRFSGGAQAVTEEDIRDRRFANYLNKYYDEIIASVRDVKGLLVFGPGEAKVEFKTRFENDKSDKCPIDIETTDKMTDNQIAEKVRRFFSKDKQTKAL